MKTFCFFKIIMRLLKVHLLRLDDSNWCGRLMTAEEERPVTGYDVTQPAFLYSQVN